MLRISKFDIFNFTAAERNLCILHGNVFIMNKGERAISMGDWLYKWLIRFLFQVTFCQ